MGLGEPSALFFVADGAAKERVQCRDSQRKKKQRLKVHTKCSETWKYGFELRKRRKYTFKSSQNRVAKVNFCTKSAMNSLRKRTDCNICITIKQHLGRVRGAYKGFL